MAKNPSKKKAGRKKARDRAGRTRSQAATEPAAKVTLGSNYSIVFRMPPELEAKPAEVERVLRRISARVRRFTGYVRVAHMEGESGFMNFTLFSRSSVRRLWTEIELGFSEKTWDDPFQTRRALERSVAPHTEPWQLVELNGESVYFAGEYDLEHPANAMLREAAFPKGSGLDAPGVERPSRVKVYIRPDYPDLDAWTYKWMMLSIKIRDWLDKSPGDQVLLPETTLSELDEYAAWHERYAEYIAVLGDVSLGGYPQISDEAFRSLRTPRLRRPILIAEAATAVGSRPDVLLNKLRDRKKPIIGPERAFMADFEDIRECCPRKAKSFTDWADKLYPEIPQDS